MIPISNKSTSSGFNICPLINFHQISDTNTTVATLIYVPVYGTDFIVPPENTSGPQGFGLIFHNDWTFSIGNTYLVESLFYSGVVEYYTISSTTLDESIVADTNGTVFFGGGATITHGQALSVRIRFTPIGTPNPINNCAAVIFM